MLRDYLGLPALVASHKVELLLAPLRPAEREALSRRFYRDLERQVAVLATTARGRADAGDRRTIAVLNVSRLLFLAFGLVLAAQSDDGPHGGGVEAGALGLRIDLADIGGESGLLERKPLRRTDASR